ncbi:MAG: DUF503 domain-containing protein [Candidatus Bipolaricaulaceae bacterium]
MALGLLRVQLRLFGTQSLKDKRSVVERLLVRARRDFNVSGAELDHTDDPGIALLGFAHLSNDGRHTDQVLAALLRRLEGHRSYAVEDHRVEMW